MCDSCIQDSIDLEHLVGSSRVKQRTLVLDNLTLRSDLGEEESLYGPWIRVTRCHFTCKHVSVKNNMQASFASEKMTNSIMSTTTSIDI